MPEKSIREMNKLERRHYSLEARTFRATIIAAIVFGLVAFIIGLSLYAVALGDQYIGEAFTLTRSAKGFLEMKDYMDLERLTEKVRARYVSLSEEEKLLCYPGSDSYDYDKYREFFEDFLTDPDYTNAISALNYFKSNSDVFAIYVGFYDYDTGRLVYIADPETEDDLVCNIGDWEYSTASGFDDMYNWQGSDKSSKTKAKRPFAVENTEEYGWLITSGVPLRNENGDAFALVMADIEVMQIALGMRLFALQYFLAMFVIVNVVAFVLVFHMKKTLVKPINAIAEAAAAYANDKKKGIRSTNRFSDLNIKTGDEVENLALIMSDMETDLSDYEESLTKAVSEKERVGTELALATRIQADTLPNVFPAFPDRKDFDIYATMVPAKEVGGDFYDFFLIDDDHLALVIADVSGKGVPAALFMMISKILVQNFAMTGISPKEVLQKVNTQLYIHNREEMFVTVWLGILDLKTGKLTAANAGHEYPLLKQTNGDFEIVKDKHGFVIGGLECVRYSEYELQMQPGSKLFVYTDGVPEATNAEKELFGLDRLLNVLNNIPDGTPYEIINKIHEELNVFVGDAPQFDDVTMLCVHYLGSDKVEEKDNVLTIEATIDNINEVTDFVNAKLEALDCSMKIQMQIDVAIDELFSNIARYAYNPETGPATVIVDVENDPLAVVITFIDKGKPFDPLSQKDPDITLGADDRKIGGLGVFLVKKTMDDVNYEYKEGKNILTIKKKI